jgi:putative ABC transport system permease protein
VLALVMRDGLLLVAAGIAVGVPAALASGRVAGALLFQRSPYDAVSLVASCLMIVAVALLACGWPALRAVRLAPADALRHE